MGFGSYLKVVEDSIKENWTSTSYLFSFYQKIFTISDNHKRYFKLNNWQVYLFNSLSTQDISCCPYFGFPFIS